MDEPLSPAAGPTDAEPEDLAALLARSPDWAQATAYERTKRCCTELTRRGVRLPSWTAIREIIGKGSPADINRAKDDFRREHAQALQRMDGFTDGLPSSVQPHVVGLWTAAVEAARAGFAKQTEVWLQQLEQSDAAREQAHAERDAAVQQAAVLEAMAAGLRESLAATEQRAEAERAAREQAERMAQAQMAEVAHQREQLEAALRESKVETTKLIERFDGERRYAMMQIEQARQQAAAQVQAERDRAARDKNDLELELARRSRAVETLREAARRAEQLVQRQAQEMVELRVRLEQAMAAAVVVPGQARGTVRSRMLPSRTADQASPRTRLRAAR